MKKKFLVAAASTAMLSGLLIVGSAIAENRVETKVTSEPIQSRATCDKAGGFSMEFDRNTTIAAGDRITIDVDYINRDNMSSLCRNIDLMIAPDDTSNLDGVPFTGWNPAAGPGTVGHIPLSGSPVTQVGNGSSAGSGVAFHIFGRSGTQRMTIDVIGGNVTSSMTVGNTAADDVIALKFLDQAINPSFTIDGVWVDSNSDGNASTHIYDGNATVADNTLCINVSDWDNATVNANVDSSADKYTFIPSNPQVAHIVASHAYEVVKCKGQNCGDVPVGGVGQVGSTCEGFDTDGDNGTDPNGTGYCTNVNKNAANQLVIQRTDGTFSPEMYTITMKIGVNVDAASDIYDPFADHGVYFDDDRATAGGSSSKTAACDVIDEEIGGHTFYNANGGVVETLGASGCSVEATNRAVRLTTDGHDLNLNTNTDDFLTINTPGLVYDGERVQPDANVVLRVTVSRAPCGEIITTDHCVGTILDACPAVERSNSITFPYFTEATQGNMWDGLALTNYTDAAGSVDLIMYEEDGDVGEATVSIAAHSMYVNTLENMVLTDVFTFVSGTDGTLGNSRSYIVATSDTLDLDGFSMIANGATGESMGYLPRIPASK